MRRGDTSPRCRFVADTKRVLHPPERQIDGKEDSAIALRHRVRGLKGSRRTLPDRAADECDLLAVEQLEHSGDDLCCGEIDADHAREVKNEVAAWARFFRDHPHFIKESAGSS